MRRAPGAEGVLAVVTAADFPELPMSGRAIAMGETGYDMWMVAQINMARQRCSGSVSRLPPWLRSTCMWRRPRWR